MSSIANDPVNALTGQLLDDYYIAGIRGQMFMGTSPIAGLPIVAISTAVGLALYNPAGNTFNLSIGQVTLAPVSGTFVLGTIWHAVNINPLAAATTGTIPVPAVTPVNVGAGAVPTGKLLTTATLPANPNICRVMLSKNATAATGNPLITATDDVNGAIILPPGCTWSLLAVGTDTTPLWSISILWQEIKITTP